MLCLRLANNDAQLIIDLFYIIMGIEAEFQLMYVQLRETVLANSIKDASRSWPQKSASFGIPESILVSLLQTLCTRI